MPIEWGAAMQANQALWDRTNQQMDANFQRIREAEQRRQMARAMEALNGPNRAAALQSIYAMNPQTGMQMEDQLYQRDERDRASQFRTAAGNMLLGGPPSAPNALNALLPGTQPGMVAAPGGANDTRAVHPIGQSPAPASQAPDGPHPAIARLDPHRDNIAKGAEIIRRLNPTDEATWQQARTEAQAAGVNLTGVPERFDPGYVKSIVSLADHFASAEPEAITVTGQRQPPAHSPDYERAARADPEKFLTFRGNQLEVTRRDFGVQSKLHDFGMQILGGVHDQATYDAAKRQTLQLYSHFGQDASSLVSQLPAEYSPEVIHGLQMQGIDTGKQLQEIARENRLTADIADDQADNERADNNAASLDRYRKGRLKQLGTPRPRAATPPKPSPPPTPNSVIGRIMDKEAKGERLSAGEQRVIDQYRAGKKRGREAVSVGGVVKIRPNEPVSKLADGRLAVVRNGAWVPAER